ncbi:TonB-dependent receptor [Sphingomonas sp.]|uniref:TonB-dependent receptor n=1 Tax=Sphingomonas sp. TaxID=28214 RepID=UPI0031DD373E
MTIQGISLAALALALAAPAAAQQATSGSAQTPADTSALQGVPENASEDARQTPPSATSEAAAQGDIVVTAQRTSSLASKTPIALSAIDGDALRNIGVTNPTRLEEQVPNLSIVRNNGLQITIRGVSSADNTEKGDPSAAFLLDGIYLARPQAQEVSFYDIARVEVLRGPQGTLYGRNTTAGVINVITNRPSDQFEAAANGIYGNYGTVQGDAMVNLPVSDMLSLRFSGAYDKRDSYLSVNTGTIRDLGRFKENISGRAQAMFRFTPDLTLLIRGDYSAINGSSPVAVLGTNFYAPLASGQPGYADPQYVGSRSSSRQLRELNYALVNVPRGRSSSKGVDGELNWAFGGMALTYLGSYREFDQNVNSTAFQGVSYRSLATGNYKQVSQELRLATDGTGPIKAQAGGYYFNEKSDNTLQLFNLLPAYPYYAFLQGPTKSETIGAFGQVTWKVFDTVRLTGGVRYSRDEKSRIGGSVLQKAIGPFNPATDIASPNRARVVSNKVTWRAGVDFDVNARTLVYGSIATGYKAGGFNGGCLAGDPGCVSPRSASFLFYDPETLTAYELGMKTRTADNKLRLNANLFYYDYKNLQVTSFYNDNGAPRQFTDNAAKASVKGAEVEATLAPSTRNRIDLQLNYLDAEYVTYEPLGTGNAPDFAGRPLDRAPRVVVVAGYTYTLPLFNGGGLSASVRTRMSDSYVMTAQAAARQYVQPSFTRTDLSLRYDAPDGKYYLQGFWRNVENKVLVTSISLSGGTLLVTPSDPTTYGIQAGLRF